MGAGASLTSKYKVAAEGAMDVTLLKEAEERARRVRAMRVPLELQVAHFMPTSFPLLPVVSDKATAIVAESWRTLADTEVVDEHGAKISGLTGVRGVRELLPYVLPEAQDGETAQGGLVLRSVLAASGLRHGMDPSWRYSRRPRRAGSPPWNSNTAQLLLHSKEHQRPDLLQLLLPCEKPHLAFRFVFESRLWYSS